MRLGIKTVLDLAYFHLNSLKEDWGNSSTFIGVDWAVQTNVKQISFFHHEPTYSDFKLVGILRQTEKYLKLVAPKQELRMFLTFEDLTLEPHQE